MDAPLSFTITVIILPGKSMPFTKRSVSLPAVPFPIAIASIANFLQRFCRAEADSATFFCGSCGKIVSLWSSLPCLSRHITLHPVRKPGSMARMFFCPSGDASNNCLRFFANTCIASSSASFLAFNRISVSMLRLSNRLYASVRASSTCADISFSETRYLRFKRSIAISCGGAMLSRRNCSFSPLRMASILCEGTEATGSFHSK